ncbi:hypothetical protein KLEP7_gp87 [Pseudaeromonas phage vB_PpeM_ KLEP7]|nr:hypothetical protein KLEP7_gp87 [Pseudaeromonas phage vB_PpeM_ KLEP7]
MFKLIINNVEFESEDYESFCKDLYLWDLIQRTCGYEGTGGDWRHIGLSLHSAVTKAISSRHYKQWIGIYKPYSIPPIGFYIAE